MKNAEKRYQYYTHKRKDGATEVIAVSKYAGRKVKAKAVCSPEDTFDLETGKRLARLRCAVKIDKKREKDITRELSSLNELEMWVAANLKSTELYKQSALKEANANREALQALLEEL